MAAYQKPLPKFHNRYAKQFYDGCKQRKLLIQRCSGCGKHRFPPTPMCPRCNSMKHEFTAVSGEGVIASFTTIHNLEPRALPMATWPADGYPINVAIVALPDADGVHLASNVVGCEAKDLKVGMKVSVVFEDVTPEVTLPKFKMR